MAKQSQITQESGGTTSELNFDVSTGLKTILGRELITDDEVAIFELVKNSFDAGATSVRIYFGTDNVVVADNGSGMSRQDLKDKWLFVAYSAKKEESKKQDFRDVVAQRRSYAGSKGVGRFSSDRLGKQIVLQTRSEQAGIVHCLTVDWKRFEKDAKAHFEKIPVEYSGQKAFTLPDGLTKFGATLKSGTVIEIKELRREWDRSRLIELKASLAKLINPFGDKTDKFSIILIAPSEAEEDKKYTDKAKQAGEEPIERNIVNGRVGNFIFSTLSEKTTYIRVSIKDGFILSSLTDRGELIYEIREPNPYNLLEGADFSCEMYFLNTSAKNLFARRVGLPSVQFGSLFLFRNGFRVFPVGNDGDDWFGIGRRKQQGYARFLGTREIIGRVDVYGPDEHFQEASSRNQGLIETPAVEQLRKAVLDRCLKRLERYVVPVSWTDKIDATTEDISRLLTDPGRARVTAAVAGLVDNDEVELLNYSHKLVNLLNERSNEFEDSLVSLRAIAFKTNDRALLRKLEEAEKRFDQLRKSEAEARGEAEHERAVAEAAVRVAESAKVQAYEARALAETEVRRANFLEKVVQLDTATILNLHHQIGIHAVDISYQIENLLVETSGKQTVSRSVLLKAVEQIAFLNRKILAISRFAAKANFQLDSGKINTDLAAFIADYVEQIALSSSSPRFRIQITNSHPGMKCRFSPMDISIIVDNLVSNAKKAKATMVSFELMPLEKSGLLIRVNDNGRGLTTGTSPSRIFEMGYTTTQGAGLGLYHVQQVLGAIGGSIELAQEKRDTGLCFLIKISCGRNGR